MAMGTFDRAAKERAVRAGRRRARRGDAGSRVRRLGRKRSRRVRDWHAWHLIGDVLRSEDLASDPRVDRRLCAAIRARLRSEAVVLAPPPSAAAPSPRAAPRRLACGRAAGRWRSPSAARCAGFVLVAGTFAPRRTDDSPAPADRPRRLARRVIASATTPAVRGRAEPWRGDRRAAGRSSPTAS